MDNGPALTKAVTELAAVVDLLSASVSYTATLTGTPEWLAFKLRRAAEDMTTAHLHYRLAGRPERTVLHLAEVAGNVSTELSTSLEFVRDEAVAAILRELAGQLAAHRDAYRTALAAALKD